MNMFEQVSSDDHQMSVAGGGLGRYPGPMYLPHPCEQTDTCKNITFPQIRLLVVKILEFPTYCLMASYGIKGANTIDLNTAHDGTINCNSFEVFWNMVLF